MRIAGIALLGFSFLSFFLPHDFGFGVFFLFMLCLPGGIVLIVLSLPQVRAARGPLVVGKILEINQTGFSHNWTVRGGSVLDLSVEFRTKEGQKVSTSGKVPVSWMDQTWLQPGMPVPLKYYPKNPKHIAIALRENLKKLTPVFAAYQEKIKNGPLVFGTLVSMEPTGKQMEGELTVELVLQFSTVDGQQITASHLRPAPQELLPAGTVFPLRYNPEEPEQIITGLGPMNADEEPVQQALHTYMVAKGWKTQKAVDMEKHGVKAAGVVLSAQPTGNRVNDCEEMLLHVKVTRPENGGTYDATLTQPVRSDALAFVQPGSVVKVFYMPENEEDIAVSNKVSITFGF